MDLSVTYDTPLLTALGQLGPHDHQSLIYENPDDRFSVAIPFIRIGLDRGEKCVYIADDGKEAAVHEAMHAQGIDVERAIASESLVLETTKSVFLKHGYFDADWMPEFWGDAAAEATRQGFSALRATGETEWLFGAPQGGDRWMEYESRLTHVLAGLNCFALCQYNRQVLPPELILDVIRTHPTVIYRGVVCRNMYYVPPDEFLGANQAAHEAERLLATLRERAEVELTLRQQRDELRSLANRLMHAQDDERRRLATMLHETTAQDLAALKMLLTRLNRESGGLGDSDRHDLAESISLTEESIAGIRTVSYLLHPPFLDEAGLVSALRWYAGGFAERSGIKVELDLPENLDRLPLDTETVLFRVVQESLTNIHRHAESETARIQLRRDAGMISLAIEDRGHGIPSGTLEQITSGGVGVGIAGMSERIEQLGGRLEVTSSGKGTIVRVWVPVEKDAN
ncbi:MAG TPA: MEDS domain-containing protein [Thermoanaerobaculia bacterium]|nr:MEDS domain-containing protein [Thermoanaerobaculia bacterium]